MARPSTPPTPSTAKDCAPALCHRCRTMGAACYWLVLPSSLQASVLVTDLLRHWWVTRAKVLLKLAAEVGLGLTGGRCRAGSGAVPCSQTSTLSMRRASLFHYTNRSHTYTIKSLRQALEPPPVFLCDSSRLQSANTTFDWVNAETQTVPVLGTRSRAHTRESGKLCVRLRRLEAAVRESCKLTAEYVISLSHDITKTEPPQD